MFRKIALTAALSVVATASLAADLPVRGPAAAPFVAPPIFSWTGFYVGAQVGYNWGNDRTREFNAAGVFTGFNAAFSPNGVIGGVHAGYNMQSGSIVYGVEADVEASGYKGGYRNAPGFTTGTDAKKNWQGSLRARLGFAFDRALIYATGGVAFANIQHSYINGAIRESFSDTRAGWTLGAGLEYAFTNNWSARAEYRYTDFGNVSNRSNVAFPGNTYRHQPRDHALRAGVSYKF